jgi:hypothetical protein
MWDRIAFGIIQKLPQESASRPGERCGAIPLRLRRAGVRVPGIAISDHGDEGPSEALDVPGIARGDPEDREGRTERVAKRSDAEAGPASAAPPTRVK